MQKIHGLDIPGSLAEFLDPNHVALIIYDMQVGIVRQVKERDTIIGRVRDLLTAARSARVRTVFTRHMSLPRELMGSMQYRTAMAWQHKSNPAEIATPFLRGNPGFAIIPELEPNQQEVAFDKIAMSAFEGTPLEMALRDCGIRTVVLAGVALEIGIEPTARHAADLGFVPVLARDACGHGNAEAAQRSIDSLTFAGDSVIAETEEICAFWKR
jgi:nicotinamidase-related amidase